jgi:hypothetical protein
VREREREMGGWGFKIVERGRFLARSMRERRRLGELPTHGRARRVAGAQYVAWAGAGLHGVRALPQAGEEAAAGPPRGRGGQQGLAWAVRGRPGLDAARSCRGAQRRNAHTRKGETRTRATRRGKAKQGGRN